MSESDLPACRLAHPIWVALSNYTIGLDTSALSFEARLARENGWTRDFAARVIGEYKRFVFLAVTAGHAVTPSDAVDQVWHLHLTYTRDYWERFCPKVLGQPLHHGPTAGGRAEEARYFAQYADTLASYAQVFGEDAPGDIWPAAAKRLRDDPRARRVHPRDGVVVPRRIVEAVVIGGILLIWLAVT